MADKEINYEDELRINADALDIEWLEHPERFAKYSRLAAIAERKAKRASERVKSFRSELILKANLNPEETLGVGIKATDAKIEAYYRNHKEYKLLKEELHEAEYELSILQGAVSAFHQRKASLENLVRLIGLNYNAVPTEPRNLAIVMRERLHEGSSEKAADKIKRKLNKEV
jgi:hypothetical protein